MSYDDERYGAVKQHMLTGNDAATMLLTPQIGTAAATTAHTNTTEIWAPGRAIILKKLNYAVKTAATGAGCSMALNVYKGTTSVGTLAVDQEAANAIAVQSADMNVALAATDYLRILAVNTTTASNASCAIGQMAITYQEAFV